MARAPRNDLTAEYVRSILDYDPETGIFVWKWRADCPDVWNIRFARTPAGSPVTKGRNKGRVLISIDRRDYLAARLAWVYMTGSWPNGQVDHRDTDHANDRWTNLRDATHSQNMFNRRRPRNNTSGFVGVGWDCTRDKWQVHVGTKMIGRFDTMEAAIAARIAAVRETKGEFVHPEDFVRNTGSVSVTAD